MAYQPRIIRQGNIQADTYQQIRGNIDDIFRILNQPAQTTIVTGAAGSSGTRGPQGLPGPAGSSAVVAGFDAAVSSGWRRVATGTANNNSMGTFCFKWQSATSGKSGILIVQVQYVDDAGAPQINVLQFNQE